MIEKLDGPIEVLLNYYCALPVIYLPPPQFDVFDSEDQDQDYSKNNTGIPSVELNSNRKYWKTHRHER